MNYQIVKYLTSSSDGFISSSSSGGTSGIHSSNSSSLDEDSGLDFNMSSQQLVAMIVTKERITKVLKKVLCHSEKELNLRISEGWKLRHLKCPYLLEIEDVFFEKFNMSSVLLLNQQGSTRVTFDSNHSVNSVTGLQSESSSSSQQIQQQQNHTSDESSSSSLNDSLTSHSQKYWICFLMEYFKNGDLNQYIKRKFKQKEQSNSLNASSPTSQHLGSVFEVISRDQLLHFMLQIAEGVQYLHHEGFVHLDLKPQNIFVTNDEQSIKIGDFETLRKLDFKVQDEAKEIQKMKESGTSIHDPYAFVESLSFHHASSYNSDQKLYGTVKYCSPEMMSQEPFGYSTDMWSLGCVFFEMIFQVLNRQFYIEVFQNNHFFAQLTQQITECVPNGEELAKLICRLLDPVPSNRPTASQTVEILKTIIGSKATLPNSRARHSMANARRNTAIPSKTITQNFYQKFLLRSQSNKTSLKPSYWEEFSIIPKIAYESLTSNDVKQIKQFLERKQTVTPPELSLFDQFSNFYVMKQDKKQLLFGISLNKLIEMITVTEHRLYDAIKDVRFREYSDVANDYFEVFGEDCIRPEANIENKELFRKTFFVGYLHLLSPDGLLLKIFERLSLPLMLLLKSYNLDKVTTATGGTSILEESIGEHIERITRTMSQLLNHIECLEIIICCFDMLRFWISNYQYQWNSNMLEFLSKIVEQVSVIGKLKKTDHSKLPEPTVFLSKINNILELSHVLLDHVHKKQKLANYKKSLKKKVGIKEYMEFASLEVEASQNNKVSSFVKNKLSNFVTSTDSSGGYRKKSHFDMDDDEFSSPHDKEDEETSSGSTGEFFYFYKTIYTDSSKCPRPVIPQNVFSASLRWVDVSPLELARQITIVDHFFFNEISSVEFLDYTSFTLNNCKKTQGHLDFNLLNTGFRTQFFKMSCPKLCKFLELVHDRVNWLILDILDKPHIKDRVEMMNKVKHIIVELYTLQNYASAHAMATMFTHPAIKNHLQFTLLDAKKKEKGNFNHMFKHVMRVLGNPKHHHAILWAQQQQQQQKQRDELVTYHSNENSRESSISRPNSTNSTNSHDSKIIPIKIGQTRFSTCSTFSTLHVLSHANHHNASQNISLLSTTSNSPSKRPQIRKSNAADSDHMNDHSDDEDGDENNNQLDSEYSVFIENQYERNSISTQNDDKLSNSNAAFSHMPTPPLLHFKSKYDSFYGFDIRTKFHYADVLFVEDERYQNYNDIFDGCRLPAIPVVEAHLREIMYIQNHYSDCLHQEELNYCYSTEITENVKHQNNMVRWGKFEQVAVALNRLEKCRVDYALQPVFQIQMLIQKQQRDTALLYGSTSMMSVEHYIKLARTREPVGSSRKDIL
ncbi:hypothetical protein C9374_009814 [Naegleria lovaniensis]|uniref:non-specific serine/threonine protein kinase n=1 Tax=Naegleria lovaniensis TaxID=51637 RepID=A0AA88H5R1_NAELO|nr:uncharacterized protein C9374_009814 [Naegleria lovaniensis]KAG2393237.1 hypothetical protein C9374_009814 [Naegleria lovaniensis]